MEIIFIFSFSGMFRNVPCSGFYLRPKILGYSDTDQGLRKHVDENDRKSYPVKTTGQVRHPFFINESGFYSLIVLSTKLESAKKFKHWVT